MNVEEAIAKLYQVGAESEEARNYVKLINAHFNLQDKINREVLEQKELQEWKKALIDAKFIAVESTEGYLKHAIKVDDKLKEEIYDARSRGIIVRKRTECRKLTYGARVRISRVPMPFELMEQKKSPVYNGSVRYLCPHCLKKVTKSLTQNN